MIQRPSMSVNLGLSTVLFGLLLQGCSVGPKYKGPPSQLRRSRPSITSRKPQPRKQPAPPLDQWWTGFNDPMLVTIVQRVLRQNLDLAASLERVNQARAAAAGAGARLYPVGELVASATAEHQSLEGNLGTISRNVPGFRRNIHEYTVGPAASWELDVAGGIRQTLQRRERKHRQLTQIGSAYV